MTIHIDFHQRGVELRHPDPRVVPDSTARLLPLIGFEHVSAFADLKVNIAFFDLAGIDLDAFGSGAVFARPGGPILATVRCLTLLR